MLVLGWVYHPRYKCLFNHMELDTKNSQSNLHQGLEFPAVRGQVPGDWLVSFDDLFGPPLDPMLHHDFPLEISHVFFQSHGGGWLR